MTLYYVTGLSGTGKSAVLDELRARRYHARGVDEVIALVADEQTIRRRLASRSNTFGQTPEELADVLFWHAGFEAAYRGFGATIIDATRPLSEVVAEVLAAASL
jgi:dephospho-CoA kinase